MLALTVLLNDYSGREPRNYQAKRLLDLNVGSAMNSSCWNQYSVSRPAKHWDTNVQLWVTNIIPRIMYEQVLLHCCYFLVKQKTSLTWQQRQLPQCWGKPLAQSDLWWNDLLAAKVEDDMLENAICCKRGRCYTDLQTQQHFVIDTITCCNNCASWLANVHFIQILSR